LDGVLLDSFHIHEKAFRTVLAPTGISDFDYRRVTGMRTDEAIRQTFSERGMYLSEQQLASLSAEKSRMAREWIAAENPVMPACGEVVERLSQGFRLAVASSASKATAKMFLERNGLTEKFECVVFGEDVRKAKPAPEIYELACRKMGLAPSECLVIEDAVSGVKAGKAAGATVWGIPTTCAAEDLLAAGADRVIDRLSDLPVVTELH
jgi:beta-phosphoglucomutase